MTIERVLADVDAHSWGATSHAYGPASDTPGLLRRVADDDEELADAAVGELYSSLLHQGTVYAASAEAVPFLVRLAAAGCRPAGLTRLVGGIAASGDEHEVAPGACRSAVAAQVPLLLPLVADADADVRQYATWALGHTGRVDPLLTVLRERWEHEREAVVRAELLTAIVRLDPAGAERITAEGLAESQPPQVRVAAVLAVVDADLAWTRAVHEATLAVLPADEYLAERPHLEQDEPLTHVVAALLERDRVGDREAACALLDAGLHDVRADVREAALYAAHTACATSRGATVALLPALVALLDDPESATSALQILSEIATHVTLPAAAPDALAALVERAEHADDALAGETHRALAVLAAATPRRAAAMLTHDLEHRHPTLGLLADARVPGGAPFPFDPALLDAIRTRLGRTDLGESEAGHLLWLLTHWGTDAASATSQLCAVLERFPAGAARALGAVCPSDRCDEVGERLRAAYAFGPEPGRAEAARALYALTGSTAPLMATLGAELAARDYRVTAAVTEAAALGPAAAELVPLLRAASPSSERRRTIPGLHLEITIADALWRITGDADAAVRTLDAVLADVEGEMWFDSVRAHAARTAADLGRAALPLLPRLTTLLDEPPSAPSAVLALLALDPAANRAALADTALTALEAATDTDTAFRALAAVGTQVLTADQVGRLTALAERDLRVVRWGVSTRIVAADEHLRTQARKAARRG
ncbi:hypothetical protein [Embleya sp. NPDC001921]